MQTRGIRQFARLIAELLHLQLAQEHLANFRAVLVDGRHQNVRRTLASQLNNQLGQVGLNRLDPPGSEREIQTNLIGGQRLDLKYLASLVCGSDLSDQFVGLLSVARPVDLPARALHRGLQFEQIRIQVPQRALFNGPPGLAQRLPIGHLLDHARTFLANSMRGLVQVAPQLRIVQRPPGRALKRRQRTPLQAESRSIAHIKSSSVDARISARWTGRTPARWRCSAPPICIKHELSAAAQTSACVSSTLRTFSLSIAREVSAFFTAKVPPKPQHSCAPGSSTSSRPRTARSRRRGASPTCRKRREWQVG